MPTSETKEMVYMERVIGNSYILAGVSKLELQKTEYGIDRML